MLTSSISLKHALRNLVSGASLSDEADIGVFAMSLSKIPQFSLVQSKYTTIPNTHSIVFLSNQPLSDMDS